MQSGYHMHFSQCAQINFCYLLEATSLAIYIAQKTSREQLAYDFEINLLLSWNV